MIRWNWSIVYSTSEPVLIAYRQLTQLCSLLHIQFSHSNRKVIIICLVVILSLSHFCDTAFDVNRSLIQKQFSLLRISGFNWAIEVLYFYHCAINDALNCQLALIRFVQWLDWMFVQNCDFVIGARAWIWTLQSNPLRYHSSVRCYVKSDSFFFVTNRIQVKNLIKWNAKST